MHIAIIVILLLAAFVGGIVFDWHVPFLRMLFHDKGHRVLLVANEKVLKVVLDVIQKYGGLKPILQIDSGGTHQTLLSDVTTVIMWVDPGMDIANGGFTFVNNSVGQRLAALDELARSVAQLGYHDVSIGEPDTSLPAHTLRLATSPTAFPGGAIGFRPSTLAMAKIAPDAVRRL